MSLSMAHVVLGDDIDDISAVLEVCANSDEEILTLWASEKHFGHALLEASRRIGFQESCLWDFQTDEVASQQFITRFVKTILKSPRDLLVTRTFHDSNDRDNFIEMILRNPKCNPLISVGIALSPDIRKMLSGDDVPPWAEIVVTVYGGYLVSNTTIPLNIQKLLPCGPEFGKSASRALVSSAYSSGRLTQDAQDYFFQRWPELSWLDPETNTHEAPQARKLA